MQTSWAHLWTHHPHPQPQEGTVRETQGTRDAEDTELEGEDRPSLRLSLWAEFGPGPGPPPVQDTYPQTAE